MMRYSRSTLCAVCGNHQTTCFSQVYGVEDTYFGQKLARRLLPHDEFLAILVRKLVCWVGLAIAELATKHISLHHLPYTFD
jgi:hypothetical protein